MGGFWGSHFFEVPGEKTSGEKLRILDFAWGELTLNDAMEWVIYCNI